MNAICSNPCVRLITAGSPFRGALPLHKRKSFLQILQVFILPRLAFSKLFCRIYLPLVSPRPIVSTAAHPQRHLLSLAHFFQSSGLAMLCNIPAVRKFFHPFFGQFHSVCLPPPFPFFQQKFAWIIRPSLLACLCQLLTGIPPQALCRCIPPHFFSSQQT